jgi:hypothetical protein
MVAMAELGIVSNVMLHKVEENIIPKSAMDLFHAME